MSIPTKTLDARLGLRRVGVDNMKISKRQLRRIIKEEKQRILWEGSTPPEFEWSPDGLSMKMLVDGTEVMSFSTKKEVKRVIAELEELLRGPMRTSP